MKSKEPITISRDFLSRRGLAKDIDGRSTKKPFHDLMFSLRASKNVKYPSVRQQKEIKKAVVESKRVKKAVEILSNQKSIPGDKLKIRATEIMDTMATLQQKIYLKVLSYFFRKIWRKIYQQLEVNEDVLMKLFDCMKKGPVVLIPSHRSYIDFLIVSYVLFAYDFPAPLIAAGEDFLNMSFVSNLLRFGGAFFLKRSFRDDFLYKTIFTEYVQKLITLGYPMEFFIEGTRSRSGKTLHPKMGMMSILTDTYFDNRLGEITFFPINLNYEKVMEADAYSREWLGEKKNKESLSNLVKASQVLADNFGRISIKFSEPISLDSYTQMIIKQKEKEGVDFDPYNNPKDKQYVNTSLAYQIVYDINSMTVWAPMSLIGALLLSNRLGIHEKVLYQEVDWLINEIVRRNEGWNDWILEHIPEKIARMAFENYGDHISKKNDMLVFSEHRSILVMAYYRNRLIHLFARDGFILVSLKALENKLKVKEIPIKDIIEGAEFIAQLLALEYIYKTHPDKSDEFDKIIEDLIQQNILIRCDNDCVKLNNEESYWNIQNFYTSVVYPFIDTYWATCFILSSLRPSHTHPITLKHRIQWFIETLFKEGHLRYYESCSVETIQNSIDTYLKMNVINRKSFGESTSIGLSEEYEGDEGEKLKKLLKRITQFRKVKSLRDIKDILQELPLIAKL